jgi:hypothetical protein
MLSLLPRCIFHNPISHELATQSGVEKSNMLMTHPQPYKYRTAVSQPVNPTVHQSNQKENRKRTSHFYALAPTLDIPFGSNKTSAKRTSPAVDHQTYLAMIESTDREHI